MKTIGIDVRMWRHPGIGRYIRELTRELILLAPDLKFCLLGRAEDRDEILAQQPRVEFRVIQAPIYSLTEQIEIPRKAGDLDLLHVPHFNIPVFFKRKLVVTIHDLIYLYPEAHALSLPGRIYARWIFKALAKKSDAILSVSGFTKNEFLKFYPTLRSEKISVTPEAVAPHFKKSEDPSALALIKEKFRLHRPFVLFVGSLKPHKNIPVLIQAFSLLSSQERLGDHELILVGRQDKKDDSVLRLASRQSFVRYLGELSDDDLVGVYNLAEVFVLPSFWEGFGLPVLEAMACGVPVLASDRSSLPEVVGDAGLLFNPDRVDALADVLYNVLMDKELRQKMSQKSLERVRQFSWQKTATETLEVYRQAL